MHAGFTYGLGQPIEAVAEVTHKIMPVAHNLGTFELLKAPVPATCPICCDVQVSRVVGPAPS